jgi:hypothetical protein
VVGLGASAAIALAGLAWRFPSSRKRELISVCSFVILIPLFRPYGSEISTLDCCPCSLHLFLNFLKVVILLLAMYLVHLRSDNI